MEGGYIEHAAHEETSTIAALDPNDLKDEVVLRAYVLFPNTGERQLIATEDIGTISSAGKVSANFYKFENLGLRLENSANKVFKWIVDKDMLAAASGIVHVTVDNDWVPATWKNLETTLYYERFKNVLQKMSEIKKLRHNWDSYGAFPVAHKTYIRAMEFLAEVFKAHERIGFGIPVPFVALCPDGSIQLEWGIKNKELEVVIPYSSAEPISTLRVTEDNEFIEANIGAPSEIERYLSWLIED